VEITREAIAAVYERIRPHLRRTPLVRVDGADDAAITPRPNG
jgi:hypothetical protein